MSTTICSDPDASRIMASMAEQDKLALDSVSDTMWQLIGGRFGVTRESLASVFRLPNEHQLAMLCHKDISKYPNDIHDTYKRLLTGVPHYQNRGVNSKLNSCVVNRNWEIAEAFKTFFTKCGPDEKHIDFGLRAHYGLEIPIGIFPVLNEKYPLQSDFVSADVTQEHKTRNTRRSRSQFPSRTTHGTGSTVASRARQSKANQSEKYSSMFTGSSGTQLRANQSQRTPLQSKQWNATSRSNGSQSQGSHSRQTSATLSLNGSHSRSSQFSKPRAKQSKGPPKTKPMWRC